MSRRGRPDEEPRRPVWPVPVALFGAMLAGWGVLMADAAGLRTPPDFGPRLVLPPAAVVEVADPAAVPGAGLTGRAGADGAVVTPPAELRIDAHGLAARVRPVGVTPDGTMQLPADPGEVGWWAGGAVPGAASGAVVMAGHVRTVAGGEGVLAVLLDIGDGDVVDLTRSDGEVVTYRVRSRLSYVKEDLPEEVFVAGGPPRLVLITCTGDLDPATGHYSRNIVVTAEPLA